jgi:hypothetical protein
MRETQPSFQAVYSPKTSPKECVLGKNWMQAKGYLVVVAIPRFTKVFWTLLITTQKKISHDWRSRGHSTVLLWSQYAEFSMTQLSRIDSRSKKGFIMNSKLDHPPKSTRRWLKTMNLLASLVGTLRNSGTTSYLINVHLIVWTKQIHPQQLRTVWHWGTNSAPQLWTPTQAKVVEEQWAI